MIAGALHAQDDPAKGSMFVYDAAYPYLIMDGVTDLEQEWYSNSHTISFMSEWGWTRNTGLGYGVGFTFSNFHNNIAHVQPRNQTGPHTPLLTDTTYSRNKQNISWVEIPIEFRFRGKLSSKGNFFRVNAGIRAGYRMNGSAYYRDGDYAIRRYRLESLNKWRVQPYLRIGWGKLGIYAGYDLLPIMSLPAGPANPDASTPEAGVFSAGLSFMF